MLSEYNKFIREDCLHSIAGIEHYYRGLKNKTVLITGGTGFMGSWLTSFIIFLNKEYSYGIKLILLSRNASESAISKWDTDNTQIRFIDCDVRNLSDIPHEINYIIHAAASPDITYHSSQPIRTYETIVNGTFNLLNAASLLETLHNIVHISSGLVYGKNQTGFYDEEFSFGKLNCSNIHVVYTEAKRMAETIVAICKNQFRLPITITRPFTFIGPFQSIEKTWAFNSVVREALLNNKIRIYGDGKIKRGYMYGSDMAAWILCMLANPTKTNIYNLGSDKAITLTEIASLVSSTLQSRTAITYENHMGSLVNNSDWIPDTSRAKNQFPFNEPMALSTAIKKTINWHQNK
jgi:dTDP-glucose 4,6-dehydratase